MIDKSITILNNTINYTEYGGGESTIIFFLGWLNDTQKMKKVLKHLSPNLKVIIPELPNFHKSSISEKPLTLEEYVDITINFIEKLGLKNFSVGGHSAGGRFAISIAGKMGQQVKNLILLAPAGYPHKPKIFTNRIRVQYAFSKFFISKETAENILIPTYNNLFNSDVETYIKNVSANTLLLWGQKDKVISPYHAKYYKDNIKLLKYEKIENADHMLIKRKEIWKIISEFIGNENR